MMKKFKQAGMALAAAAAMCITTTASAVPVIGVAVDGINSNMTVGTTVVRPALGADAAIEYFIPLATGADCTYGVDCGTMSDSGTGGTLMSMFLMFNPVELQASTLSINFEDLDLAGANDPVGFFESIEIFDSLGVSLTGGVISNIANLLVDGDAATQQLLSLDLGVLTSTTYYAELQFSASSNGGTNTPEYLIATIDQTASVPEPAILALLSLGLFGMGVVGRNRKH